ncbi:MAG: hypothetical protein ABSG73_14070 [Candidatus Aminicenantales bacterium]|jgi:hypothetical protein
MEHFVNRFIIETKRGPHYYINLDQVKRIVVDHKDGKSTAITFHFSKDDQVRFDRDGLERPLEELVRKLIEIEIHP